MIVGSEAASIEKAIQYFQQALTFDPNDALAYAGLAEAHQSLSTLFKPALEVRPKPQRQEQLNSTKPLRKLTRRSATSRITLIGTFQALSASSVGIELNPNLPQAHQGHMSYLVTLGRADEAVQEMDLLRRIDPLLPSSFLGVPWLLFQARHYEKAIEAAKKVGDERTMALSLAELGQREEAVAAADRALKTVRKPAMLVQIASAYAVAGKEDKARSMLGQIEAMARARYICGFNVAGAYAPLGDKERALRLPRESISRPFGLATLCRGGPST